MKIGPGSGGQVRGSPGDGPCDGTHALLTLPQTGPSILFNFTPPVSSVSIVAGDYGPSDSDVMTLAAYSEVDAGGAVVGEDTRTLLFGHETGCLGLSVSASGIRSVEITSAGPYPNSIFVDNLDFVSIGAIIEVVIDIKPGGDPNSINCNNDKGVIAVAILTTDDTSARETRCKRTLTGCPRTRRARGSRAPSPAGRRRQKSPDRKGPWRPGEGSRLPAPRPARRR